MVDAAFPMLSDVDLVDLPLHNALSNPVDVVLMSFIGVRDGFKREWRRGSFQFGGLSFKGGVRLFTPRLIASKDRPRLRRSIDNESIFNLPQDSEQCTLSGGMLEAERLRPLDKVVGESTGPKRRLGERSMMLDGKRFDRSLGLKLVEYVRKVRRSKRDAVVP